MKQIKITAILLMFMFLKVSSMELPSFFTDNMVLQQLSTVKIWGSAAPAETIDIIAQWGESVSATADLSGKWMVSLNTPGAGGPYTLTVKGASESLEIKNILLGEVWFCSGQSNMEMPLSGFGPNEPIQNSELEIKNADYSSIRMFTVTRNASFTPQTDVKGSWQVCSPQTAAGFSAAAYFFGKKLFKELNVPIGLIHSSWGGTPAQAWMDGDHLQNYMEYKKRVDQIETSREKQLEWLQWIDKLPVIKTETGVKDNKWSGFDFNDVQAASDSFDDSQWSTVDLPRIWEQSEIGVFDGAVWFRKNIKLPEEFLNKDLVLELGPVDDMDHTYFNGVLVGAHEEMGQYQAKRVYQIPAALVRENNLIAVRVIDTQGGGGIFGQPEEMKIYPAISSKKSLALAGSWKYLPVAIYKNGLFYVLDIPSRQFYDKPVLPVNEDPSTPSTLFNGMVHPFVPYTIKGAIWYQGEANVVNPLEYETLFPDLIQNWREVWGQGEFPFYFVQIAPWNYGGDSQSQLLRDAQRKSLRVKNSGMAVIVDIGSVETIHPANKHDVGNRLALWALAKDYGNDIVYSGPLYKSMEIKDDKIIISFDYTAKGLKHSGDTLQHFLIAAADKNFIPAQAIIDGDKIIVSHGDMANPKAVRYLWDNTSLGGLFNSAELPASSFRTDDW